MERELSIHCSFVCFNYEFSKGLFLIEKELLSLVCDIDFSENTRSEDKQNNENNTSHNFCLQCAIPLTNKLF